MYWKLFKEKGSVIPITKILIIIMCNYGIGWQYPDPLPKTSLVQCKLVGRYKQPLSSDDSIQVLLKLAWVIMFMIQAYFLKDFYEGISVCNYQQL